MSESLMPLLDELLLLRSLISEGEMEMRENNNFDSQRLKEYVSIKKRIKNLEIMILALEQIRLLASISEMMEAVTRKSYENGEYLVIAVMPNLKLLADMSKEVKSASVTSSLMEVKKKFDEFKKNNPV